MRLLPLLGILAGCATQPSADLAAVDAGPYPDNYKEVVAAWVPGDLQASGWDMNQLGGIHTKEPEKCGWLVAPGDPKVYGYCVEMSYRVKRVYAGFGAHISMHRLFLRDGAVKAKFTY